MPLPTPPEQALAFLALLNGDIYDPDANPFGMDDGGHIPNWPPAMNDMAVVGNYLAELGAALQALATQVSDDAASAAAGSGSEATIQQIWSGLNAYYLSIRRIYAANVPVVLTDGATINWDMSAGIVFTVMLGGATRTLANPTNQVAGKSGIIIAKQDATGGRAITGYGSNFIWIGGEPVWPTAPGARTLISYLVEADGTVLLNYGGSSE